jgi:adenine-specific DNA-methyltransferase
MAKKQRAEKTVETLKHGGATRKNIPTAEYQSVLQKTEQDPILAAYERRNKDLDPQLVWRGKDMKDWSDLVVHAPPLYIQEKIHPKALIEDLLRQSKEQDYQSGKIMADLFSDFNGIPKDVDKTEFYQHDQNWSNRMILGDSLQVMASLAEREGLRAKVQCIYLDPPYGIKFDSNFQWSTTTYKVTDGKREEITREPEQVKAFRDTWRDGVHSFLTYLRDRLTVARELLSPSGSIFVQIGDENLHRIRALLDEVFGEDNFFSLITLRKLSPLGTGGMANITDYIVWYAKDKSQVKFRPIFDTKKKGLDSRYTYVEEPNGERRSLSKEEVLNLDTLPAEWKLFTPSSMLSSGFTPTCTFSFNLRGNLIPAQKRSWRTNRNGIENLIKAGRLVQFGSLPYLIAYYEDNVLQTMDNIWTDSGSASTSYEKIYVVQTSTRQVQKCLLMATDPGDLVLDPTCGSGTTATVAEQWGRRWITIDTSRVALALARTRIMGARYPYYILADSREGQLKESEITHVPPSSQPVFGKISHGFVYERVPHITLKSIANNAEIEVIWNKWQEKLEPLRERLNKVLNQEWKEWEVPIKLNKDWDGLAKELHSQWSNTKLAKQKEIDASISAKAEFEYLFDRAYENKRKIRVAGPFTVESLSPHRTLVVDENDELIDPLKQNSDRVGFTQMILDNLKVAGVQQSMREDKLDFTSLVPWPGDLICAEGRYMESGIEKRAAIFVGPEFGTVQRIDLVTAAREAGDAGFDVLISCAFNYEAHTTEFNKLGRIPVLKARMNADLHMSDDLKNTGKGNLFVIFGEPEIEIMPAENNNIKVSIKGIYVFDPTTGKVRSDNSDGIACWFIDTDYNEESFFVRHAYFLGANDPYSSLKTSLKAEINKEAWDSLHSDISRPFPKPKSGRIAVKAINHLGDEVMKVFKID